jgi:SAM-dependent methyltransferase
MSELPESLRSPGTQSADHFEKLGAPRADRAPGPMDLYRFRTAFRALAPGSVLDVGAYFGHFMRMAMAEGREVAGTEVNEPRRQFVNGLLGRELVRLDFRNGRLNRCDADEFDNAVCMEVLEHVPDHEGAVAELCRVARRRVLITVPYRERIKTFPCIHCGNFTPQSGHLHSYDAGTFAGLTPPGWRVLHERPIAKPRLKRFARLSGKGAGGYRLMRLLDHALPGEGRWLFTVLGRD